MKLKRTVFAIATRDQKKGGIKVKVFIPYNVYGICFKLIKTFTCISDVQLFMPGIISVLQL